MKKNGQKTQIFQLKKLILPKQMEKVFLNDFIKRKKNKCKNLEPLKIENKAKS